MASNAVDIATKAAGDPPAAPRSPRANAATMDSVEDTPAGRVVAEVGSLLARAIGVANNALGQVQGQLEAYDQQYFDGAVGTTVNEATATLGEATAAHRERAGEFLGAALERARAANAEVLKHAENLRSGVLPELPVRTLTASLARAAQATEFVKERAAQYDARFNASSMISNSIRWEFWGAQVDWSAKQSRPRTFSEISIAHSPSLNVPTSARPISMSRYCATAFASAMLAFPLKSFRSGMLALSVG